jgi:hypothetical protein
MKTPPVCPSTTLLTLPSTTFPHLHGRNPPQPGGLTRHLGTRRQRVVLHARQHLGRAHQELAGHLRLGHHVLLRQRDLTDAETPSVSATGNQG